VHHPDVVKRSLIVALLFVVEACGAPTITPAPSPSDSAIGIASTIAIDCGPDSNDVADCLAIVEAAAKAVDPRPEAGSRAVVSKPVALADCPGSACPQLAVSTTVAIVTFVSASGQQTVAHVITSPPPGGYVGVVTGNVP
jgi:hypothetical protein